MTKIEKTVIDFFLRWKNLLFFALITLIGLLARITLMPFVSSDMSAFLIPWYKQFLEFGGLKALKNSIGDYNLLYQTIIALISQFKVTTKTYMFIIKTISIAFDYVLAISVSYMLKTVLNKGKVFFNIVYAVLLFVPTHLINSAYWGQCDAIYVSFLILTLWYLYSGKYKTAFAFYGLTFAFKLQGIFILPFILAYYIYKKSFSIFNFFITVAVIWASGIVAFIYGRDLLAPLKIYYAQTGTYKQMWLNYPSFWVVVGNQYEKLHYVAIALALVVVGIGFFYCISTHKKIDTAEEFFSLAGWFVWSCLLFLPAMHERYGFILDVILLMLAVIDLKYLKYFLVSNIISTLTYGAFVFSNGYSVGIGTAVLFIVAYVHFTYKVFAEKDESLTNAFKI